LVAVALLALQGCSFLIDVDRNQCERDRDCERQGYTSTCEENVCVHEREQAPDDDEDCDGGACESGGDAGMTESDAGAVSAIGESCAGSLRCVESAVCFKDECVRESDVSRFLCEPEEPEEVETVRFTMPVRDFVSDAPLVNMRVRACLETDVSCSDPVATFDDTEGTGDIEMELPYEFAGFLEVQADETLTSLWYFTKPLLEETDAKVLKAVSPDGLTLLASIASLTIDASRGVVILETFDCTRSAVGGVHFEESKKSAVPFFIIDGLPNKESTITVRNELENQAAGGFVNATPGFTNFTARLGVDGPVLGTFNANVKANTVTYVDIHP
jgi:hypothetical protein